MGDKDAAALIAYLPHEYEDRLRELCLKQQEINRLLDLHKSDVQAANDNTPLEVQEADTFVKRLAVERGKGITRIAASAA